MPWAANPVLEISGCPTERDVEAAARRHGDASPDPKYVLPPARILPPSDHLTAHQFVYIFLLDGILAGAISGGINFAVAYALYHDKGTPNSPIRLFQFPNTLAGDAAVTVLIQFLATWFVETVRVNLDLRKGLVQPIGFIPEPECRFLRWYMFLDRHVQTDEVGSARHWLKFIFSQVVRSLILVVVSFPFIFGACVGALTLVGKHHKEDGDWYFSATWAPEFFKLVQGALLGLLFTPVMASFWIVRCGWALQDLERRPGGATSGAT